MTKSGSCTCRVLVLYTPRHLTPFREHVFHTQLARIRSALRAAGWEPLLRAYHPRTIGATLVNDQPDVVLNLAYGFTQRSAGLYESQADITMRLEDAGLRIVGSSSTAQRNAQDKLRCAEILRAHGVDAPRCLSPDDCEHLTIAVEKPRFGACHRGVRIVNARELTPQRLTAENGMLVQEYVDGREFTVAVLQVSERLLALPTIRIQFEDESRPHVMVPGMFSWTCRIERRGARRLGSVAIRAFRALQMRDYARFDFRMVGDTAVLLDANALPNLDPVLSYLPMAAEAASIGYERLIALLVRSALRRRAPTRRGTRSRLRAAKPLMWFPEHLDS
jgi:D-alanine-D-alanine ligase